MKTIRRMLGVAKNEIRAAFAQVAGYFKRNWKNTDRGLSWLAISPICLIAGVAASQWFVWRVAVFLIATVLSFLLLRLAVGAAGWLLEKLLRFRVRNLIYMGIVIAVFSELAAGGSIGTSETASPILGAVFGAVIILLCRSLWAFLGNRVHTPTILISLLTGGGLFAAGCVFVFGTGFSDTYVQTYLQQNPGVQQAGEVTGFAAQSEPGQYTVESLEYSPDKDAELDSDTIDLSFCVENSDGLRGFWRTQLFGYDVNEAAIAGKIWYPKELSGCPVLFLIHGNHSILTESYLGYEYLGEYLASYGYVVVSVDENVLNLLSHENDARAILLLENIKKVQEYNEDEENLLYGKMDYDKIALAGHSRGGETVAAAYLFNQYDVYPENGMFDFDYHFAIRSIIAIAPTVDQYQPADHEVGLQDVNYLQLQGANDQDVSENMGNTQYSHITFSGEGSYIKSSLYIAGANHGQFNSLWGSFDLSEPNASLLNVGNLLTEDEQQEILKLCAKTFLDQTLKGDTTYADLLTDYAKYSAYLPKTVYIQQYQKSDALILCNYEEDSDLETATDKAVALNARHMRSWTEEMSLYSQSNTDERENYVLRLSWKDTDAAAYELRFSDTVDLTGKKIAFDICNLGENSDMADISSGSTTETAGALGTVFSGTAVTGAVLTVTDADGNTAVWDSTEDTAVYPALPVRLGKLQYLTNEIVYKHEYQTLSAPLYDFDAGDGTIDLSQIQKIAISFPDWQEGKIGIDNICVE